MTTSPRRSERLPVRRKVHLVFHDSLGASVQSPAETFAVNCHGAGLYTQLAQPLGSEVYLLDKNAGVGAWGRVVWLGPAGEDGLFPLGVEFARPANYWGNRLNPLSWLPYCRPRAQRLSARAAVRRSVRLGSGRVRWRIRSSAVHRFLRLVLRLKRRQRSCRCCGNPERLVVWPGQRELLCNICYDWVM